MGRFLCTSWKMEEVKLHFGNDRSTTVGKIKPTKGFTLNTSLDNVIFNALRK